MASTEDPNAESNVALRVWRPSLGGWIELGGARFRVWAPDVRSVDVVIVDGSETPRRVALTRNADGTFGGFVPGLRAGDRYLYQLDGKGPFPDPASRFQPEGVHGPSELVDPMSFPWSDAGWRGIEPEELIVYELHVGTFSPEGTFEGVTRRLPLLRDLGVTAIELMPLHDFEGARSWGYDGVDLFAPSRNYGRPDDLRRLVDTAHRLGLTVILDVVYNHFGPVGNYTLAFSPHYLSKTESSAWAACVNLTEEGSEHVRAFFIENARHWVHEYHADGLRFDATHALIDRDRRPLVAELVEKVRESIEGRRVLLIAEDHRNLAAMVRPDSDGGWGLDGVWADDLHHEIRRHLTGDDEGYYRDYTGTTPDIATTINQGWFFSGQHSTHLSESRGTDPSGLPPRSFHVCIQNHDQVGNRALGDRLNHKVDPATYRATSTLLLMVPQTPILFMGQEWASSAPFQYFTDHDGELGRIVTEGRRREFQHFRAFHDESARDLIPDPQDPATFDRSRLDWSERDREPHAATLRLYRDLLRLRRAEPALRSGQIGGHQAFAPDDETVLLRRDAENPDSARVWVAVRFRGSGTLDLGPFLGEGGPGESSWEIILTSNDPPYHPETPAPAPRVTLSGPAPVIVFDGPAAVVLRQRSTR